MPPKPAIHAHPIGLRIKEIRTFLGRPRRPWSQRELATVLEMDVRTLRRREADGELGAEDAARLAALGRCDVEWLLTGQGGGPGTREPPASRIRTVTNSGLTRSPLTRSPGRRPTELEKLLGLVRDALLGAVDRALARDHELEQTRRGYFILGSAFLRLGHDLEKNGVDTTELRHVALELQERGQP